MPSKSTTPTARIEHTCDGCAASINPGDTYFRRDGVWTIERLPHEDDEDWERVGGSPELESFVKSGTDKLCASCAFDTEKIPEKAWSIYDVVSWVKRHGGKVTDRDYSYKVSRSITIPEHNWYFTVDGDETSWGYSAGQCDDLRSLVMWLSFRPSMPNVAEVVLEHACDGEDWAKDHFERFQR